MMETLNQNLFLLINATPSSPEWMIKLAIFFARDLISIVPLLIVALWLWGQRKQMPAQRQVVIKTGMALVISVVLSWVIGQLFPHPRPFVVGLGYNFLHHAPDDSFPSDHGTVIFTFALAFLCWPPHLVRRDAVCYRLRNRLVPRLPRRALAAGYAWRPAGRHERLPACRRLSGTCAGLKSISACTRFTATASRCPSAKAGCVTKRCTTGKMR
ncbi:Putative undecaprenyl-diphosphatase ybjG [Cedecea neteri]|uniref:Undecaprenyl-diphosphatase ybjG n=1 Tax=Cedecea neteri TaxID=158822 RepID=A0A2X3IFP8_9ENTR|nr:Putative undecaprenyl-diphosphatase ybjG [Cedecea neteri]